MQESFWSSFGESAAQWIEGVIESEEGKEVVDWISQSIGVDDEWEESNKIEFLDKPDNNDSPDPENQAKFEQSIVRTGVMQIERENMMEAEVADMNDQKNAILRTITNLESQSKQLDIEM